MTLAAPFFRRHPTAAAAIRALLGLMLLLAVVAVGPVPSARAACNVGDAIAAAEQAVKTTAVCQPLCEKNKYDCYGAAGLAIVLTEVSRRKNQDVVNSFCSSVQGLIGNVKNDGEAVQDILGLAEELGLSSAQSETLSTAIGAAGEAIEIVNCACMTEQLQLQNESSFGACINDVLEEIGCGKIDWTTATVGKCDPVGGFIGDIVNDALDEIVSAGCTMEVWECGEHVPEANYVICERGYQSDRAGNCIPCNSIAHGITLPNGECGCETLYKPDSFSMLIGQSTSKFSILRSCSCQPPLVQDARGHCLCPFGEEFTNGTCSPCPPDRKYVPYHVDDKGNAYLPSCSAQCPLGWKQSPDNPAVCVSEFANCDPNFGEVLDPNTYGRSCMTCKPGQRIASGGPVYGNYCEDCPANTKPSPDRRSCVPGCYPGQVLGGLLFSKDQAADPNASVCQTCPANTYAAYENAGSSKGSCVSCPPGTTSNAGATSCMPLDCGPGSFLDPANPNACKSCPATQIYFPTEKKIVSGPGGSSKAVIIEGHCGCGDNQVLKGSTCVCAANAVKIPLPQAGSGLFACQCPEGAQFDAKAGSCACPKGAKLEAKDGTKMCVCTGGASLKNGLCQYPSIQKKAPSTSATKRKTPSPACRKGEERNANGDCVKPARHKDKGGPAPVQPVPPGIQTNPPPIVMPPPKVRSCPPGTVPGPLGKHCFPVVPKGQLKPKDHTPSLLVCPRGMVPDAAGRRCVPL